MALNYENNIETLSGDTIRIFAGDGDYLKVEVAGVGFALQQMDAMIFAEALRSFANAKNADIRLKQLVDAKKAQPPKP
jgi:hypothetical protein